MRYVALASDYDGTLAKDGHVHDATLAALDRLRASGRKLLLVTGRELDDLIRVFPAVDLFDRVVAENGAVLYDPSTRSVQPVADAPPDEFVRELQRRGVSPLSVGRSIVATWKPQETTVLQVIRDMGLELQVIFNKDAVMVLPSGINKASGLRQALDALKLSIHNTVAVGDAENDHAFIAACECAVAVANALESLKAHVDWVTSGDRGEGVIELIDRMIASDLVELAPRLSRHDLPIGASDGSAVKVPAFGGGVLIAGPSGSGKTTVVTVLLERLCDCGYQFCVIDPEGDYHEFPGAIAVRGGDWQTLAAQAMRVLERPSDNAVVSLVDLRLEDRPQFLNLLLPHLLQMRASTSRPHWIVIDEAHHLLPSTWQRSEAVLPAEWNNVVLVTVQPDHVAPSALRLVDTLVVVGHEAQATVNGFGTALGGRAVRLPAEETSEKTAWLLRIGATPLAFRVDEPASDRRRHRRKYAEGELPEDRSFYFRGPEGRLNLRAQNLGLFTQLADGVDDETWEFHRRQHDISRWFETAIKDPGLAAEAADIESRSDLSPADSRARIRAAIERRYTAPA